MLRDRRAENVKTPRVEILYFDGCPNYHVTRELVERVAAEFALPAQPELIEVPSGEAARTMRFLGSPTVRVDGRDVEPGAVDRTEYVRACRVYRGAHGFSGQPDEGWVREALAKAVS
jgi:hypothetical protein